MDARIETSQEQINTKIKTDLEDVEAMDLEANPEEMKVVMERQEIPNEEATSWTWNPKRNIKRRWMPG
jgi:hypothetical protein